MHTPVLTPPQEQVLALISAGSTVSQAAQSADVHRNTVHNWVRSQADFRLALSHAQYFKALFWREQAEQLASAAIDAIRATMTDAAVPAAVRLKAAQSILALAATPPPEFHPPDLLDLLSTPVFPPQPRLAASAASAHNPAGCPPVPAAAAQLKEPAQKAPAALPNPARSPQPDPDPALQPAPETVCPPGSCPPVAVTASVAAQFKEPAQKAPAALPQPSPAPFPQPPARPAPSPAPETVHNSAQPVRRAAPKIGRNHPCPCGSGKKFKHCCLAAAGGAESLPAVA